MDHSGMDHSGMNHGDMDDEMCSMAMTLNTGYKNLCILTSSWHIHHLWQMVLSLIVIAAATAGYELFKRWAVAFDRRYDQMEQAGTYSDSELKSFKLRSSMVYGLSVLYSFTIMLVFMTFNLWVMLAVAAGAAAGHFLFATKDLSESPTLACH